mgnify:CR=1 FL=1
MEIDINTIRGLITVFMLVAFLGLVRWAYSRQRKADFAEAAALPLADDNPTDRAENRA